MNDFPKVLVVDDGERKPDRAISAELAELGYASVTASLEAAEDVLSLVPSPAAIFLEVPDRSRARRQGFIDLANRLKARPSIGGVPIIVVDAAQAAAAGGYGAVLQSRLGRHAPPEVEC